MGVIFNALRGILLAWVQQRCPLVGQSHLSDVGPETVEFVMGEEGMAMPIGGREKESDEAASDAA